MIIIIMIACCYVGALGPKAELILVCAAKLGIYEEHDMEGGEHVCCEVSPRTPPMIVMFPSMGHHHD